MDQIILECMMLFSESVEKASAGNFDDNDDKLKCYLKCVFEKFQLVKDDISPV